MRPRRSTRRSNSAFSAAAAMAVVPSAPDGESTASARGTRHDEGLVGHVHLHILYCGPSLQSLKHTRDPNTFGSICTFQIAFKTQ